MGAVWWYCIKSEREKRSTNSIFSLAGHENNITQPKTDVLVLHLIFQRFDCCGFVQMSLFYISSFNGLTVIVVLCFFLCLNPCLHYVLGFSFLIYSFIVDNISVSMYSVLCYACTARLPQGGRFTNFHYYYYCSLING